MKKIPVAAVAVIVLWFGLSTIWMSGSDAAQNSAPVSHLQTGQALPKSCGMMASMRGDGGGTGAVMPGGGGMTSPRQSMKPAAAADGATSATSPPSVSGIMTEPVAPVLGLHELFATPPAPSAAMTAAPDDVLTRLQSVEDRLADAILRLESTGTAEFAVVSEADRQPSPSWPSQLLTVLLSGPVIGFLLLVLLVLAISGRGRSVFQDIARRLQRSPKVQAAWDSPKGRKIRAVAKRKQRRARTYLKTTELENPQGQAAHWGRVVVQAERFQHRVSAGVRPLLIRSGLMRQHASHVECEASVDVPRVYGELLHATDANGKQLTAGVFEEGQVRAAAGLTLALGSVAFAYAYFAQIYAPIQIVTTLFFFEFLIRVMAGIEYSPMGLIAYRMTRRQAPQWVSAQPKRFAWTMGLVMSLAMMIITNSGIRGPLPLTICLICLTLMWLEAILGLCLGCEIHRQLVRRGWMQADRNFEICTNGSCTVQPQPQFVR